MKKTANSGIVFVSVLVLLALAGPVWAFEDSNLVSHWRFDEGAGTTAYDSAGDNDGTIYGAQWTTGQIEGALDFDGVDDYVEVMDDESQQISTNQITLSAWIKLGADVGNTQRRIICKQEHAYIAWGLEIFGGGYRGSSGNQLVFHDSDGGTAYRVCISPTDLNLDQWYHVAAIDNAGAIEIYINGRLNHSCEDGYGIPSSINTPIIIGTFPSTSDLFFNGLIDDVRIYDRALSEEEIEQLYQGGLPDLVAIDIKPHSCPNPLNLKSRGVLPVAVLGSEDFDVSTIDAASIFLEGVPAIRSNYEDVATPVADGNECECTAEGPDGYTDLTLKFKTQEIVEKFINEPNELVGGLTLSLTLTGALFDDTLIEGTDCVFLVGNVPKWLAARRWDANGDGLINMADFTVFAENWLQTSVP